jgi:hypothetical protein
MPLVRGYWVPPTGEPDDYVRFVFSQGTWWIACTREAGINSDQVPGVPGRYYLAAIDRLPVGAQYAVSRPGLFAFSAYTLRHGKGEIIHRGWRLSKRPAEIVSQVVPKKGGGLERITSRVSGYSNVAF